MEKFTNLCPKDNLTNPKSVHNAIAGCGGPLWEETKDYQCELAKEIDKRGIPFALKMQRKRWYKHKKSLMNQKITLNQSDFYFYGP